MSYSLIPLKDIELKQAGIPFKAGTLKKWHQRGKNKEIFVKIEGKLFVVQERWDNFVDRLVKKTNRKN